MSILIGPAWGLIPVAIAASLTYNWQSENPPLFAFLTYKDKVMPILNNPQAQGLRYYIGLHDVGTFQDVPKIIVVGVDAQGNDIIDQSSPDSKILNFVIRCPNVCDNQNSPLIHDEFVTTKGPKQITITRPIPFSTAVNMTAAWQSGHSIKSMYVAKSDLQGLFQTSGQNQARFYFGKDDNGALRMVVVPVDVDGNDVIGTDVHVSEQALCTGSENVCDTSSPLYHYE